VDIGGQLLVALVSGASVMQYHQMKLSQKYFIGEEVELYLFIQDHLQAHKTLPAISTLKQHFGLLPKVAEPPSYYYTLVESRFQFRTVNKAMVQINQLMKEKKTTDAVQLMDQTIRECKISLVRQQISDFGAEGLGIVLTNYYKSLTKEEMAGLWFDWPRVDKQCQGMGSGDVVSIVGRPAAGKTWLTLRAPLHSWLFHLASPALLTMEMPVLEIAQRLVAMYAKMGVEMIQKSALGTVGIQIVSDKMKKLKKTITRPFWIIDAKMASTPQDIEALIQQLHPTSMSVDGAYMLKNKNKMLNKWARIDANVEELKEIYMDAGIPASHSYQLNRESEKKMKKDEKITAADIYGSDAIGQFSSVVLGLLQQEGIETLKRREVTFIKGRQGQSGTFAINFDFASMNLEEYDPKEDKVSEDMQFI
jgi:replicative DNA helicase